MTDTTPTPPEGPHADLDAITARADAATPGPWYVDEIPETGECRVLFDTDPEGQPSHAPITSGGSHYGDADLIAHARTDVPALVAEVHRLRAALSDSVPREVYDDIKRDWFDMTKMLTQAIQAEHAALAVIEQVRALVLGVSIQYTVQAEAIVISNVADAIRQAPADALARVKAEAGAQALDDAATDERGSDAYGVHSVPSDWLRARAATLREGAGKP